MMLPLYKKGRQIITDYLCFYLPKKPRKETQDPNKSNYLQGQEARCRSRDTMGIKFFNVSTFLYNLIFLTKKLNLKNEVLNSILDPQCPHQASLRCST